MNRYFTADMDYLKPEPRHRLVLQSGIVTLQQRSRNNFAVRYGKKVDAGLTYGQATRRLGEALMHQAACDAMLVNA
jgi:hypothetical protein